MSRLLIGLLLVCSGCAPSPPGGSARSGTAEISVSAAHPGELAGTYRFEVTRTGGPVHVFYARSYQRPRESEYEMLTGRNPSRDGSAPAYALYAAFHSTLDSLPRNTLEEEQSIGLRGDILVQTSAAQTPDGARVYRGSIEPAGFALRFQEDRTFIAWANERFDRAEDGRDPDVLPARFVLHPDGRVTVTQVVEVGPDRRISMHGQRISLESF